MIWPSTTLNAEIHIHAARLAVWEKFIRLREWPQWRNDVQATQWQSGERWQEGACFVIQQALQHRGYLIRMVSVGNVTVWETTDGATAAVYSLHLSDQLGGCKATLRCTYHGFGAVGALLGRRGQNQQLRDQLAALKQAIERK